MFCSCCHAAASHHEDGCHALHRDRNGALRRCSCRRGRERVNEGPDHLADAVHLANARARRRQPDGAASSRTDPHDPSV